MIREDQAVDALAALGNRTRLRLFRLLVRVGEGGLNVGDIQKHLGIPASTLAHHLAALTRAGLVRQERQGREIVSIAGYGTMNALVDYLTKECCMGLCGRAEDDAA